MHHFSLQFSSYFIQPNMMIMSKQGKFEKYFNYMLQRIMFIRTFAAEFKLYLSKRNNISNFKKQLNQ